jgi:hypothetical protein
MTLYLVTVVAFAGVLSLAGQLPRYFLSGMRRHSRAFEQLKSSALVDSILVAMYVCIAVIDYGPAGAV